MAATPQKWTAPRHLGQKVEGFTQKKCYSAQVNGTKWRKMYSHLNPLPFRGQGGKGGG